KAFAEVCAIDRLWVHSPTPERREGFAAQASADLCIHAEPRAKPESAVGDANVVLCAARSYDEQPILFGEWLADGAAVVSIGSTVPSQREIDVTVVDRSDLIVC